MTLLFLIIFGFILGAIMGSFGLVLLDRWENLSSVFTGRSMCLSCKHPLAAKDLIPLVSYVNTSGKCRYCHCPIPPSCPLTEIAMGIVFALTAWWIGTIGGDYLIINLIARWLINRSLVLLVIHDHNTHYLHWIARIVAVIVSVGYVLIGQQNIASVSMWSSIVLGCVFLLIYGCGFIIHWIKYGSWQQGFGFGDVLTALLLGRITPGALGYDTLNLIGESGILTLVQLVLGYLVVSSTVGLLYWGYLWYRGDQEIEIAFIPGMVIGFWIYIIMIIQFHLFF